MDHDEPWSFGRFTNADFHELGGWGVYLFFAISGFLVCTRILEDEAVTKRFRIGDFYLRRLFRIQPAAVLYLAIIAVLTWLGVAHERRSALLGGLFLYQNYLINVNDVTGRWFLTGHFWTLSIEEHFYLLLSLLLFWFRRGRALVFSTLLLLLYVFARLAIHFSLYPRVASRFTELNLQYLFIPALFAVLLRRKPVFDFAVRYLRPYTVFIGTLLFKEAWFLFYARQKPHDILSWFALYPEIFFYSFGFWVVATTLHPKSLTTDFLEIPFLRFLGRLSYSIYLWHALFLIGHAPVTGIHAPWLLTLTSRPWRYLATFGAALVSYYGVEKPLIRLGHRIAPPATPGHRDLDAPIHSARPKVAGGYTSTKAEAG